MKKGTIATILGLVLIAAAICLTLYNVWDTWRAGNAAANALEALALRISENPDNRYAQREEQANDPEALPRAPGEIEYPDYVLNPEMDMPILRVDDFAYIGVLSLPTLGREFPINSTWNYDVMRTAPCRYTGSAYLDDMIICGHDYATHFGGLGSLAYGDAVIFTDVDGNEFVYEVLEIETIPGTGLEEMQAGEWDLTLFTCTFDGRSRVTVRCRKISASTLPMAN